ncbi:hypothetical protein CBS101457_000093 [Exobasidium rhododendri]|nr:hypothetical protein CBS101457_000093 [Exobasidium rhododendri]
MSLGATFHGDVISIPSPSLEGYAYTQAREEYLAYIIEHRHDQAATPDGQSDHIQAALQQQQSRRKRDRRSSGHAHYHAPVQWSAEGEHLEILPAVLHRHHEGSSINAQAGAHRVGHDDSHIEWGQDLREKGPAADVDEVYDAEREHDRRAEDGTFCRQGRGARSQLSPSGTAVGEEGVEDSGRRHWRDLSEVRQGARTRQAKRENRQDQLAPRRLQENPNLALDEEPGRKRSEGGY